MSKLKFLSFMILTTWAITATAQEDELLKLVDDQVGTKKKEKVHATFKTTRLINLTTNEQVKKGELDFRIAHKFDDIAGPGKGTSNFFGFDKVVDIRFSFDYGLSNKWAIGIGRSSGAYDHSQVFDLNTKYKLVEQVSGGFPFSISTYGGLTYTTMPSSGVASTTTNFTNGAHRLNYFGQILFAKKVNTEFSFIIGPTIVHRNLVQFGDNNTTAAIAVGLRYKISKRSAIIADYYQVLNLSTYQNSNEFQMPIGLGYELETGGHVFHVLLSTNKGLVESQFLPNSYEKFTKGEIRLGFNISRTFSIGKD